MPSDRDLYEILGVPRGATEDEIRSAYRALARKHHPDVSTESDAEVRFGEIQEAYAVLSDTEKRAAYDRYGRVGASAGGFGGGSGRGSGGGSGGGGGWGGQSVDPSQFNDIFEQVFGGRGGFAGGGGPHRPAPRRGVDITRSITITFMTAVTGGAERLELDDGTSVDLTIPAGIEDGGKLRIRGRGGTGTDGGARGDVIVAIHVGAHPSFTRRGLDLVVEVPVTIIEAALGVQVRIALLSGSVDVRIPEGTSSGTTLRVPGQGITNAKGSTGDLRVVVQVVAPEGLSGDALEALNRIGIELSDPRTAIDGVDTVEGDE